MFIMHLRLTLIKTFNLDLKVGYSIFLSICYDSNDVCARSYFMLNLIR